MEVGKGAIGQYVHNAVSEGLGKIGVLVALESPGKTDELVALGRQLAMHVASSNPLALDASGVDPEVIKREKDVLADKFRQQGKPEAMIEKIVESGLKTFFKEQTFLDQPFIFDDRQEDRRAGRQGSRRQGRRSDRRSRVSCATPSAKASRSRKAISRRKSPPPPVKAEPDRLI